MSRCGKSLGCCSLGKRASVHHLEGDAVGACCISDLLRNDDVCDVLIHPNYEFLIGMPGQVVARPLS
jgi:hypothetical protein